jgi:FtsH-binding integral membrane protein
MVILAGGYVLYYTSNILHHYPVGSHVAASLALFAAVALLFWYILRIVMALSRR